MIITYVISGCLYPGAQRQWVLCSYFIKLKIFVYYAEVIIGNLYNNRLTEKGTVKVIGL